MNQVKVNLPGFLIALALSVVAVLLSMVVSFISVILIGFLLGVIVGNVYNFNETVQQGFSYTGSKLLELSVLFLAFSISFSNIKGLGWQSFLILIVTVVAVIYMTIFLAKVFKCPDSTAWLTGFGTAICGSSAIAAASPVVGKKKDDVAIALAVVNILGSIAMVLIPFVFKYIDISAAFKGLIIGGTLHSVGNVAGAAYAVDSEVGEIAITIKLARVALLSPAIILFNYLINKDKQLPWKDYFKLPAYLWGFIAITIIVSFVKLPPAFVKAMEESGKLILTLAMTAIGLKIHLKKLISAGRKAMLFGIMIYIVQLCLIVALGYFLV